MNVTNLRPSVHLVRDDASQVNWEVAKEIWMTYQNTPHSDPSIRPDRIRFLAEIPIETYQAIDCDLSSHPNWDRYFIMNNPVAWPEGMYEAIEKHTRSYV